MPGGPLPTQIRTTVPCDALDVVVVVTAPVVGVPAADETLDVVCLTAARADVSEWCALPPHAANPQAANIARTTRPLTAPRSRRNTPSGPHHNRSAHVSDSGTAHGVCANRNSFK